jgi:hypothetical protein
MNIAVISSNSEIGQIIVSELHKLGHIVHSYGRRHATGVDFEYYWDLSCELSLRQDINLAFYLTFDHSIIKNEEQYLALNYSKVLDLLQDPELAQKIVIPLSNSANPKSKSRYGLVKWKQEELVHKFSTKSLRIGWLMTPNNGGQLSQYIMKSIRLLRLNVLPQGGNQKIYFTYEEDLENAVKELCLGAQHALAYKNVPGSLASLIFEDSIPRRNFIGIFATQLLKASPYFFSFLNPKVVRTLDSARSLI